MFYLEKLEDEKRCQLTNFLDNHGIDIQHVCSPFESMLTRKFKLDIIELDRLLGETIPEYDADKCTYRGKVVSMHDLVAELGGPDLAEIIAELL